MKTLITLLIAFGLPVFAAEPAYDIKELTKCEQDELKQARDAVVEAKKAYDTAQKSLENRTNNIKDKYLGRSTTELTIATGTVTWGWQPACYEYDSTDAEIKGKWVIITTTKAKSCTGAVTLTQQ